MVVSVTLNPLLERRLFFEKITEGKVNRSFREVVRAGGKGINVSRQLNKLGIKNQAVTFLGGENGKHIRRILLQEDIDLVAVSTRDNTRWGCLVQDFEERLLNTYFSPDCEITDKEVDDFLRRVEKTMQNCSVITLCGSSPNAETDAIYPEIIKLTKKYDKFCVLDTYGDHLEACLNEAPELLHINKEEVEKSLNLKLKSDKDYEEALNYFYSKGIKITYISDGKADTWASKYNFHYKIKNPEVREVDSTGSGDAFVAGAVYGIEKAIVFDEFSLFASKLGALNAASSEICSVEISDLENSELFAEIIPVGKKMKIIDDSPTV